MSDYKLLERAEYERLCQRVLETEDYEHHKAISEQAIQAGADRLASDIAFSKWALKTLLVSDQTSSK